MDTNDRNNKIDFANDIIKTGKKLGADDIECFISSKNDSSMTLRSGIIENYTENDISSIGVRVIKNKKQISILFQDKNEYKKHLQDAVTAVQLQKDDEFAKIPKPSEIEQPDPNMDIDCFDGTNLTKDKMHKICMEANEGLFSEKGITNSEGITVSNAQSERCFVSSNGFYDYKKTSCFSCFVSAIATNDSDGSMENDYEYDTNVFYSKMKSPLQIAKKAAKKAIQRIGAIQIGTKKMDVIFDKSVSSSILNIFSQMILGEQIIASNSCFKPEDIGKKIFNKGIKIVDDPYKKGGQRSGIIDIEGKVPTKQNIVEDGYLKSLFINYKSALKLGIKRTGHGMGSVAGLPFEAPYNLSINQGEIGREKMMKDAGSGIIITDTIGHGINYLTGDFSYGFFGYYFENGVIKHPVTNMTVAGNIKDLFLHMIPLNDFEYKTGVDSPSLFMPELMIAGSI